MKASMLLGEDWEDDTLEVLWEDADRLFCKVWRNNPEKHKHAFIPVPSRSELSMRESVGRLAHEWELRDQLDPAWAMRPLEMVRERGRTMLVVEYGGGEPLARLSGQPMDTGLRRSAKVTRRCSREVTPLLIAFQRRRRRPSARVDGTSSAVRTG